MSSLALDNDIFEQCTINREFCLWYVLVWRMENSRFTFTKIFRIKLMNTQYTHGKYMRIMGHKIKVHLFCLNACFRFMIVMLFPLVNFSIRFDSCTFSTLCSFLSEKDNQFLCAKQINSTKFAHIWFFMGSIVLDNFLNSYEFKTMRWMRKKSEMRSERFGRYCCWPTRLMNQLDNWNPMECVYCVAYVQYNPWM